MSTEMAVYVVDVGSPQGGLAWARVRPNALPEGHHDIELMCTSLLADLTIGTRVALGFEGPLFLPIRDDYRQLVCGRTFEPLGFDLLHALGWSIAVASGNGSER